MGTLRGQTHLGMLRGARTLLFDQIQTLPLRMYHHKCKKLLISYP